MTAAQQNETIITTPSDLEIRIEREFDAPREFIWKAHTDPDLLGSWLGPADEPMEVESDFRVGGTYRWVGRDPEGNEFVFSGEVLEIEEPSLIVQTFRFENIEHDRVVDRLELTELEGGRTRLVTTETFTSKEERDGKLASGMESGVRDGYEALDRILSERA